VRTSGGGVEGWGLGRHVLSKGGFHTTPTALVFQPARERLAIGAPEPELARSR
jgi:hypothetical protein